MECIKGKKVGLGPNGKMGLGESGSHWTSSVGVWSHITGFISVPVCVSVCVFTYMLTTMWTCIP